MLSPTSISVRPAITRKKVCAEKAGTAQRPCMVHCSNGAIGHLWPSCAHVPDRLKLTSKAPLDQTFGHDGLACWRGTEGIRYRKVGDPDPAEGSEAVVAMQAENTARPCTAPNANLCG